MTVYFVTRPIDSRSCLLSLLLSSRNLDIDLNQQALVQLSPPPLPKLNQIQLWVILQPELGLTCHTNPPPLPMPSHLMLFYDQPPPFGRALVTRFGNRLIVGWYLPLLWWCNRRWWSLVQCCLAATGQLASISSSGPLFAPYQWGIGASI